MISLEKSYEKFIFLLHEQLSALMTNLTVLYPTSQKNNLLYYIKEHIASQELQKTHTTLENLCYC